MVEGSVVADVVPVPVAVVAVVGAKGVVEGVVVDNRLAEAAGDVGASCVPDPHPARLRTTHRAATEPVWVRRRGAFMSPLPPIGRFRRSTTPRGR